jgi:hypothetical protein
MPNSPGPSGVGVSEDLGSLMSYIMYFVCIHIEIHYCYSGGHIWTILVLWDRGDRHLPFFNAQTIFHLAPRFDGLVSPVTGRPNSIRQVDQARIRTLELVHRGNQRHPNKPPVKL